jgi:hypothetical protein
MTYDPASTPDDEYTDAPPPGDRRHSAGDRRYSPAGAIRERPIPCLECGQDTWNVDGVCDACDRRGTGRSES